MAVKFDTKATCKNCGEEITWTEDTRFYSRKIGQWEHDWKFFENQRVRCDPDLLPEELKGYGTASPKEYCPAGIDTRKNNDYATSICNNTITDPDYGMCRKHSKKLRERDQSREEMQRRGYSQQYVTDVLDPVLKELRERFGLEIEHENRWRPDGYVKCRADQLLDFLEIVTEHDLANR